MKTKNILFGSTLLAAAALSFCAPSANAANLTWAGTNDNNSWNYTDTNWSNSSTFSSGDNVTFDDTATSKDVTISGTIEAGSVTVTGSGYTFDFSDGSSVTPGGLTIADGASLEIKGTGTFIGSSSTIDGSLTLSDSVTATFGGDVSVGSSGTGELTITGGDVTFSSSYVYIGMSNGILTITGGSTTFNNYAVYVGCGNGTGKLTISGGTTKFSNNVFVGSDAGTGIMEITGGKTTFGGPVYVGNSSTGKLTISDDAETTFSKDVYIGNARGATGTMEISGGETKFESDVYVGHNGTGSLTICQGTTTFKQDLYVGDSGTGSLAIGDGTTTVEGALIVNENGSLKLESGTLNAGSISVAENANASFSGGTLNIGTGGITGSVSFGNDLTVGVYAGTDGNNTSWSSAATITLTGSRNGTTFYTDDSESITLSGSIIGNGNLIKDGAGTLTISGSASLTGTTTVSAGTLAITGTSVSISGGLTSTGSITVGENANLSLDGTIDLSSAISNSGTVTVSDSVVFVLNDTLITATGDGNTYTIISNQNGGSIDGWDSLTTSNFSLNGKIVSGRSTIDVTTTAGQVAITFVDAATLVWNGTESDNVWTETRTEYNKIWKNSEEDDYFYSYDNVTFADGNDVSKSVVVSGKVEADNVTVTGSGYTFSIGEEASLTANSLTIAEGASLKIEGEGSFSTSSTSTIEGSLTISGGETTFSSGVYVGYSGGTGSLEISGGTTTVEGTVTVNDNGSLTLTGGTLNAGELTIGTGATASFSGGNLNIGTGGITGSVSFGDGLTVGLYGEATSLELSTITLTGTENGTTFYTGDGETIELSGTISGSGNLIKTGEGTLTISGTASMGALTVNGGSAELTGGSVKISGSATVSAGSSLSISGTDTSVSIGKGLTSTGSVSVSNGAGLSLTGTIDLSSAITNEGTVTVSNSVLFVLNDALTTDGTTYTFITGNGVTDWSSLTVSNFVDSEGNELSHGHTALNLETSGQVTFSTVSADLVWDGSDNSTWTTDTSDKDWKASDDYADYFANGDSVTFDGTATSRSVTISGEVIAGSVTVTGNGYTFTFSENSSLTADSLTIDSGASLVITGAGTFTTSSTSTINGSLTIGSIDVTDNVTTTFEGTVTVGANGSLSLTGGTITLSEAISNSGTVTVSDNVVFVLDNLGSGGNSYTVITGEGTIENWDTLTGSNFSLNGVSLARSTVVVSNDGQVTITSIIVADLVWNGTNDSNVWTNNGKEIWLNGEEQDVFYNGDNVTFDDTASGKTVSIVDGITAGKVTISSGSYIFTISDDASLSATSLTINSGASLEIKGAGTFIGSSPSSSATIDGNLTISAGKTTFGGSPTFLSFVYIGYNSGSSGKLTITDGDATFSVRVHIGQNSGASGSLTIGSVDGTGGTTKFEDTVYVGYEGTGELTIFGGETTFGANVSVGNSGTGKLTIFGGETTFSGSYVFIGNNSGSFGTMEITGGTTKFENEVRIGDSGTGELTITGGDVTFSSQVCLGRESGSSGTLTIGSVDGTGGETAFKKDVYVGRYGIGELTIFGGETTFSSTVYLGYYTDSSGTMEITGGETSFGGTVYVGYNDTGKLTISDDAETTFSNTVYLGYNSGSSGTIEISGGKTTFEKEVRVGNSGTGKLTISGGETTFSNSVYLGYNSDSSGTLTITGGKTTFSTVSLGHSNGSSGTMEITDGETTFGSTMYVGEYGTGELTISGGKTTFSRSVYVGEYGTGSLTIGSVDGTGGETTFSNTVDVGHYATGTMEITGGSTTFESSMCLGFGSGASGTMEITGGETSFGGAVYVGYSGTGELTISGGETTFSSNVYVGYSGGTGSLTISGGTITLSSAISNSSTGSVTVGGDVVFVLDSLGSDGTYTVITGEGTIDGWSDLTTSNFSLDGKMVSGRSTIDVGTTAGQVTINYVDAATLVWNGTSDDNVWTETRNEGAGSENKIWKNSEEDDYFYSYDNVTFADGEDVTKSVTISGTVEAGTVMVTGSGYTFTFSEDSSVTADSLTINSGASLTLAGSGELTASSATISGSLEITSGEATITSVDISSGGELTITGGETTFSSSVTVAAESSLSLTGGTVTLSEAISNSGTVTVSDNVVFVLDNLGDGDTYTIISGGEIKGWDDLTNSNFMLDGSGLSARSVVDVSETGQVTITEAGAIDLVWKGTTESNVWKTDGENIWEDSFGFADAFRAGDSVTFGSDGEKTVSIVGKIEAGSITVTGSGYTFDFSDGSSVTANTLTINSGASLEITSEESGSFTVSSTATIDGSLTIGENVTAEFGGTVYVGYFGTGELIISGDSTTFKSDVYVGCLGTGELTISGGETTFSSIHYVYIGQSSNGILTITGGSTTFNNGAVYVGGGNGTGKLTISGGTTKFNTNVFVGSDTSTGTIEISENATTTFGGDVYLGNSTVGSTGTSLMTISGGKTTFEKIVYVGTQTGTGTMEITGGETTFKSSVTVAEGSSLSLTGGTITLSSAISNSGTVTVSDSVVFVLDNLTPSENTYTLISGEGTIDGWNDLTASNFSLNGKGLGRSTVDVETAGQVAITFVDAATLVWNGTASSNVWTNDGDKIWLNGTDSDYFYSYDNVTFGSDGTKSVSIVGTIEAGTITVTGNGYTFTFSEDSSLTADSLTIDSGASLEIKGSGTFTTGSSSSSTIEGSLTLSDSVTTTFGSTVYVGSSSTGTLTISGGETKFSSTVYLGRNSGSSGTMEITGEKTTLGSPVYVGYYSTGELTIFGGETTFGGSVFVGYYSTGELTISGGETTFSKEVYLGRDSGSSGTLTISGGETTFGGGGTVYVGFYGTGTLTITGGETTFEAWVFLGINGFLGTMEISGGTTTFSGYVYLGYYAGTSGTLTISDGETTFGGNVYIGYYSDSLGELTISGGETTFSSSVTVATGSSLSLTGGTITLSSAISNSGTVTVGDSVVFVLDNLTPSENTYTLISGGTIDGWSDLTTSNFSLDGNIVTGRSIIDVTTKAGQVTITYVAAENLVWNGTNDSNVWTNNGEKIWLNGTDSDYFYSYDNVTFGENGTKSVSIVGTIEAGSITVTGNGYTFTFSEDSSLTADSLTIESAGSLEIKDGTTTIEGAVWVDEGSSLAIKDGTTTIEGAVDVHAGSSLAISGGTTTAGSISIGADCSIELTGGELTVNLIQLFGDSSSGSFSGGILNVGRIDDVNGTTTISFGDGLTVNLYDTTSLNIDVGITLSGTVTFNAEDDETIELYGALSGSGKLVKDGEGTLTISGDNTFSGGTTISSGTVVAQSENALGTGAVAIDDGATLELSASGTFSNATSGNGTLSITNNATVSFGSNVGVKNVNVASEATLSGATTLTHSNAQLILAGALVLNVSAGEQVSFTNGGTVTIEDTATLKLSGISLSSIKPLSDSSEIGPGSSITIFSGATIEGDIETFLKTDSTLYALSSDYAVVYDPDKGLTVTILESGNASSLTSGLKLHDGIGSDFISAIISDEDFGTGFENADELNPIVRALVTGNISEVSKMMDTLAPNDYAAMVAMPTTSFYNDVKAIDNRLAARRGPIDENARWEFFAQAQGTFIENDDARDTQTFDFDLYGVLAGADYRVNEGLTVGVTVGYDYGKADIHNSGGKIESDDVRITLFAGQQIGEMFFVNAGAQVGYGHYEAKRKTPYGNANGDTDGWNAGVFADVGMMLTLSEELKISARPYVGLAYLHSEVGSFDDNLFDVDDFHGDSLRASVGCGLFWGFDLAEAAWIVGLDASYSHDFCGDEVDIDATYMSTGKDFGITAKALSKDIFSVGPTVSVGLTKNIDIFAGYAFQAGTDSSIGHNVNAGLKVTF